MLHPAILTTTADAGMALPHPDVLRGIFEQADSPLVVLDAGGRIRHVNPAFETNTGYRAGELDGQRSSVLCAHLYSSDFFRGIVRRLRRERRWQGEIWSRRRNGEEVPEWLSINALDRKSVV